MPNEFLSLCNCRLLALRRENDEVVAEVRCKIERHEEGPGTAVPIPPCPAGVGTSPLQAEETGNP